MENSISSTRLTGGGLECQGSGVRSQLDGGIWAINHTSATTRSTMRNWISMILFWNHSHISGYSPAWAAKASAMEETATPATCEKCKLESEPRHVYILENVDA